MNSLTNWIDNSFKNNFKKRFILLFSVPFLLSLLFLIDFFILPDFRRTERIVQVYNINVRQNVGGTMMHKEKVIGYKHVTAGSYKFSTMDRRIENAEAQMVISPIFKTVKSVLVNNKIVTIQSGFNGINGVFLVLCNSVIFISICFVVVVKTITENARLNLIYLNVFLFLLWVMVILKYSV